jgi:hypothetical protein
MENSRDPLDPDRLLRDILEPRPESVERIVRQALSAPATGEPRWRPAAVSAAVAGLAAVALLFAWQLGRFEPERRQAAFSIVNEGGVLIATSPSGDWLVHSAEPRPKKSEKPGIIIISYGDKKK